MAVNLPQPKQELAYPVLSAEIVEAAFPLPRIFTLSEVDSIMLVAVFLINVIYSVAILLANAAVFG